MQPPGNDRFSSLIEPHLDALFRAAYRLTRNRPDAEDLVQETCVRAYTRIHSLKEDGPVKSWLLRVMHNLFVDDARRSRVAPFARNLEEHMAAERTACPSLNPEESLARHQRMTQLEAAWLRLDGPQRALLALRAEGYAIAEIATIAGITPDAVGMRLQRARQNLTRHLQLERTEPRSTRLEAIK